MLTLNYHRIYKLSFFALFFALFLVLSGCNEQNAPLSSEDNHLQHHEIQQSISQGEGTDTSDGNGENSTESFEPTIHQSKQPQGMAVVQAARLQIGQTIIYDPSYVGLSYPGGDVPLQRGVCTDVIIRSLRVARDLDLQQAVHEDMQSAFHEYPSTWGLSRPDTNIDHRRVPNLQTYFTRHGFAVGQSTRYMPGDIITCTVGNNRPHIMIVSDKTSQDGEPYIIQNIGSGTKEEPGLFSFAITGHFRIPNIEP